MVDLDDSAQFIKELDAERQIVSEDLYRFRLQCGAISEIAHGAVRVSRGDGINSSSGKQISQFTSTKALKTGIQSQICLNCSPEDSNDHTCFSE